MQPQPDDLVLVALLNSPRDLALAREEHWYRIPVRHMPRRALAVPWIAFYQTKAFGDEKWAINYFAAMLGYETTTRLTLLPAEADHPRAHDEYYRLRLGPLQALAHPIASRSWKRVLFLVVHWAQVERAWDVSDLLRAGAIEKGVWRALERMRALRDDDEWDDAGDWRTDGEAGAAR